MKGRSSSLKLSHLFTVFAVAPGLLASDVVLPQWAEEDPSFDQEHVREIEDPGLFPKNTQDIDIHIGASYMYDSNPNLTRRGMGTSLGVVDFGFGISNGLERDIGAYYDFGYKGNYYSYDDSSASGGGSPLDHRLNVAVGLNRAKTKFRLSSSYYDSNGNTVDLQNLDRETRRADSGNFDIDFSVVRKLPHGSLEASTGYSSRDFAGAGLNDGQSTYGDVSWYYRPGFAPKTDVGVGVRFGTDSIDGIADQQYVTPSFRLRYRMSSKTSFRGSIGREYRELGGGDSNRLVYSHGLTWAPSSRTTVDLSVKKSISPSYLRGNGNYDSTQVYLRLSQRIGRKLTASTYIGTEDAEYFQTQTGTILRDEQFLKLGLDLSHPIRFGDKLNGSASVFYNYTQNDSTSSALEFEQHVTGVRVGFQF